MKNYDKSVEDIVGSSSFTVGGVGISSTHHQYYTSPPTPEAGGTKHDAGKIRFDLLPAFSLKEVAKVLTFGADKYAPYNWQKGFHYTRLLRAVDSHMNAWRQGEDKDPETGLSHVSHAACSLLFLIWMEKFRPDLDDRNKNPDVAPSLTMKEGT